MPTKRVISRLKQNYDLMGIRVVLARGKSYRL